jgi:hypothetical protein
MRIPPFNNHGTRRGESTELTAKALTKFLRLPGLMRPKSFVLSFRAKREILLIQSAKIFSLFVRGGTF